MKDADIREIAEIAELAHLAEDDPRRVEAMRSSRTRALLAAYQDFQSEVAPPEGARMAEADAALAQRLERELALPTPARTVRPPEREPWWRGLFAPAARPAWALLVVLVAGGVVWRTLPRDAVAPGRAMRGAASREFGAHVVLDAAGPRFAWDAVSGADHYVVRVYATDLVTVLAVHETDGVREWAMPLGEAPEGLEHGAAWQVSAYRGEELLAQSAMETLPAR